MSGAKNLASAVLAVCEERGLLLATAESCTGGMIAAALTDIAGSSSVVDRGFVTYSNAAKTEMLGVQTATLDAHGAVSAETAREMAAGALARSAAGIAIAVTGIAGPGGGSAEKPVGLVWFGLALEGHEVVAENRLFTGLDRAGVRAATVDSALRMVLDALKAG
ncbi:CinA family protein [Nitratireductor pacificus]|uniref:CinA domain-containing protein n=1 Tax=Nitratireductor pacificus pht-3B TaxID=391937 RepID=K2LKT7_9HYPH|nr:CinA family protein [Nitratireductor pacificus]EKF18374.1 CinA domain-containing protein [Nitratireductor pacificus pht-3B]